MFSMARSGACLRIPWRVALTGYMPSGLELPLMPIELDSGIWGTFGSQEKGESIHPTFSIRNHPIRNSGAALEFL